MKIDEASINHNALRLIKDIISEPYEYKDDANNYMMTLCILYGVIQMADAMKEILKV